MQETGKLVSDVYESKKKVQIANIKEELDLYSHDLPALNTVYLILRRMRNGAAPEN